MSTEYTHFSKLSFDTLFARGVDGSELPIITAAGVIQNVTISGATVSGALSVTSLAASGTVTGSNLSGTNTNDVTLVTVGSTPNTKGASLSGQALTLQPADGTNPGLLTAGTQTIGGAKTFLGAITASNLLGTNTGDQNITLTGNVTGSGTGSFATTISANVITNSMINSAAAIAYSKLNLTGSILNADIVAAAGIPYSKLTLTGSILNADIVASAGIPYSKLSLTTSIVNGDIATAAGIAVTKLANGTANQIIGANSGASANEFKSLAVGTAGTDFAIAHSANTITFNIPDAGTSNRGLITTGTQTIAGDKTFTGLHGLGSTNSSALLNLSGSTQLSGVLQIGIWSQFTLNSSATGNDNGSFVSTVATANTAFTCTEFSHLNVNQMSKGAASTITRLNGIKINSAACTAGTNNAFITDNTTYTGNYFINSTSTRESLLSGDLRLATAGKGLLIKEGTNARMGTSTLVAGTVTVSNTSVTASSRIFLSNVANGGTAGFLRISAITAGTSFVITSSSGTDTSTIAWMIVEPA